MNSKNLDFIKSQIGKRIPKINEWIKLEGLIEKVDGNKLTINIASIRLTEDDNFSGSTSGYEFCIPITIDIG